MTTPDAPFDLSRPRTIHVVGIGGAGMSAIAAVLADMGHQVSGSDLRGSAALDRLAAHGVRTEVGHRAENLPDAVDLVAASTAIPAENPEVAAAVGRGVQVARRAELLAAIAATRRTVAVAGTHGKTTTSSMLALVLVEAGIAPSFIIGGDLNEIGSGSAWGTGDLLVVEADESDGTFLELPRAAAIITNVEPDHLEHYGGWAALEAAFDRFADETSGPVVACADDPGSAAVAARVGASTYGTSPEADLRLVDVATGRSGTTFTVERGGAALGSVHLPVAGLHNARNAAAAIAMALELGAPFEASVRALGRFGGVARRFEHRGETGQVTFVDDYAHLPTEVVAALAAARDGDWGRVVCAFQPHRYSRTESLWRDFADAFVGADVLAVTDVYPSGEQPRPGVSGRLIVDAVLDAHPRARVAYLPHRDDLLTWLAAELRPGDLCITLGAGDLTTAPDEVQRRMAGHPAPPPHGS